MPPYSLELNPTENICAILKRKFTNKLHHSLEEVSDFIKNAIEDLPASRIKSVNGFDYIFAGLNWTD
ncbi:MAG TPA: hypothetical protein VMU83_22530 [Hanamia sp.]|nr:hypothetical protein [Hanamia sp.]